MGDAEAHYRLAVMYHRGEGVEKNVEKKIHHLEESVLPVIPKLDAFLDLEIMNLTTAMLREE